jgi:alpha-1,3-rhamnosyl/mannosyltransferase
VVPLAPGDAFAPGDTGAAAVPSPYVLHVGDLHARRNLGIVLDAIVGLRVTTTALRTLTLVLAGRDLGVGDGLQAAARAHGHEDALIRLGVVDETRLLALYRGASVFVYPSRYEGFGLPLVEAMACGVPVVASRSASIPEVAGAGAVLVDPDDRAGFARALAAAVLDPAFARERRMAALERARAFSWSRAAAETIEVYDACLSQRSR